MTNARARVTVQSLWLALATSGCRATRIVTPSCHLGNSPRPIGHGLRRRLRWIGSADEAIRVDTFDRSHEHIVSNRCVLGSGRAPNADASIGRAEVQLVTRRGTTSTLRGQRDEGDVPTIAGGRMKRTLRVAQGCRRIVGMSYCEPDRGHGGSRNERFMSCSYDDRSWPR